MSTAYLPFIIQHRETGAFPRRLRTAKTGREIFKWLGCYWPEYVARFATVDDAKAFIGAARINPTKVTILEQREGGALRMIYPICLALNAVLLFALAILWEVELQPSNPIVPIGLIAISLIGFLIAADETRNPKLEG